MSCDHPEVVRSANTGGGFHWECNDCLALFLPPGTPGTIFIGAPKDPPRLSDREKLRREVAGMCLAAMMFRLDDHTSAVGWAERAATELTAALDASMEGGK